MNATNRCVGTVVDYLIDRGVLYADNKGNAVFLLLGKGRDMIGMKSSNQKTVKHIISLAGKCLGIKVKEIELDLATELPRERILTHEEIRLLIENANPPLKWALLLALNTGMFRRIHKQSGKSVCLICDYFL